MERKIIIYGAGGAGRELSMNLSDDLWVEGFIDDTKEPQTVIDGITVLGGFDQLEGYEGYIAVCVVGNPHVKKDLIDKIKAAYPKIVFPSFNTRNNTISDYASFGEGCVVCHPYNIICPGVTIGNHVWINAMNSIGHGCKVGDYTTMYSGIFLGGESQVGEYCVIGTGAVINPGVKVGNNVTIGANSTVIRDVPDNVVVAGTPAKVIREVK